MTAHGKLPTPYLAAQQLEQRIRTGEWKPGGNLPSQRNLAEELGISRNSLREALAKLESLGLIEVHPSKGVTVLDPSKTSKTSHPKLDISDRYSIREVMQLRLVLEKLAVQLALNVITPSGINKLQQIVKEMTAAADSENLVSLAERDEAFHELIFSLAGNLLLSDTYLSIRKLANLSRDLAYTDPERIHEPIAEHQKVVNAFKSKPDKAVAMMEQHVRSAAERIGIHID
jgi:GntR family transcriptional repressor for pyruvate dehydrogenase complex